MSSHDEQPRDEQETLDGDTAGVPVGHAGTRVEISERRAWPITGAIEVLGILVILAAAIWLIVLAAIADESGANGTVFGVLGALLLVVGVIGASAITIVGPGDTPVVNTGTLYS